MKHFFIAFCVLIGTLCPPTLLAQSVEIDSLYRLLGQEQADTSRVDILNELAFQYVHQNPSIAMDDVQVALQDAGRLDYVDGKARAYNVLGSIHWALSNYALSMDAYFKAANIYDSTGNKLGLAKCYNNIGELYKKIDDLDKALEYHLQSLELKIGLMGPDYPFLSYINIAEIYLAKDNYDEAEKYYLKIKTSGEGSDPMKTAYSYVGLGRIALERKQFEKSEEFYFKALTIRQDTEDRRGVADAYFKIGELMQAQRLHDSAEVYFNKALGEANDIGAKDMALKALYGKTLADSSRNNYKAALQDYMQYTALKDSTFNAEKSEQIARIQTAYETELLKKENEASRIKVRQQNTVVIGVVMALLLSFAVAAAFYKQRKIQQSANKLLAAKNIEISERNNEIEQQSAQLHDLNNQLEGLNEQLEKKVKTRTKMLEQQNEVLSHYAFINAHELRAPVANILGLVHLLEQTELGDKENDLVLHLKKATSQLDHVIQNIREKLEDSEDLGNKKDKG